MKFGELFSFKEDSTNIKRLSNLGVISFGNNITEKNKKVTPHYEINETLKAFETMPIIASSINQLVSFIIPNKELKVDSEDKKTKNFYNDWLKQRKTGLEEAKNILTTNIVCGNGFKEKHFTSVKNSNTTILDNFFSINDASRMYVNPDDMDGEEAFIYELPIGIKNFTYMGKQFQPKFYEVQYIKNYTFTFERVYGIPIPAWKLAHYKSGWSRDNLYGRSQLTAAIDAVNIFKEIMSSWDTIAKTRQIDHKLISLADNETGMMVDPEQIEEIEKKLNDTDNSYSIIGLPLKFVQTDISTSDGFNLMENALDILRKQIMMSLLPQHLTPWSGSATTQGSESAMPPFMLRLKSKQNEFINFLNSEILDELRKTHTWLSDDATFVFDEPQVLPVQQTVRYLIDLQREDIITSEEVKTHLQNAGILNNEDIDKEVNKLQQTQVSLKPENTHSVASYTEAKGVDTTFRGFQQRLNQRHTKAPFTTSGWDQIKHKEVGGHVIRLVDTPRSVFLLFDGLELVESFDKEVFSKDDAKKSFNEYIEKVKKSFEKLITEETPEDKMFDELEEEIKEEYKQRLDEVKKLIKNNTRKTESNSKEAFVSDTIFGKLDNAFKGFNKRINDKVNKIVKKFNVNVIKSDDELGDPSDKVKKMMKDKNDLMAKSLKQNITQVKDQQVQTIRSKLSSGIAAGQTVEEITKNIEKDADYDKSVKPKIQRAVQTTGRNSTRLVKLRKWKEMGIEEVTHHTREDERVRPEHKRLNNKVFSINKVIDWYANNTIPGGFFNCRCTHSPYM